MDLNGKDQARVDSIVADLTQSGFKAVDEHTWREHTVRPGMRVRHSGEQWIEALDRGTGVLHSVYLRDPSPWSQKYRRPDVEVIFVRDKPMFASRVSQLADYHVAPALDEVVKP